MDEREFALPANDRSRLVSHQKILSLKNPRSNKKTGRGRFLRKYKSTEQRKRDPYDLPTRFGDTDEAAFLRFRGSAVASAATSAACSSGDG
jgi:hypothetical protein